MEKVNIIYLLPEMKGASGGAKVIYNHSLILNNVNKNINSKIIHLKKKFSYKLEQSLSKRIKLFDKKKDFIIIPEIWAHFATDLMFSENKINYAIMVQGFYHMNSTNNFINLKKSYEGAKLIITT